MEAEQEMKGHKCQDFITSWEYSGLLMGKPEQTTNKRINNKQSKSQTLTTPKQKKYTTKIKDMTSRNTTKISRPAEQNNGC